ncbi:MAG: cbb3-type cytochrome oxidase assembly protein CcoS [Gammaproteobacteria bacterium]
MDILYLLIPLAVIIMIVAIGAFMWAVKSGQYEDLEGPAHRILMDDDDPRIPGRGAAEKDPERLKDGPP